MRDERLTEMLVFKSVVEFGGFTAAAHHLGVSQPYVSKLITNLEQRLGVSLIHRSTRSQSVTEDGYGYLNLVERIFTILDTIDSWAYERQINPVPAGELRVSAPIAFGIDQIAKLIPDYISKYPQVTINLSLTDEHESLLDGSVDVAIRMGKLSNSSLISKKLCPLKRMLVASQGYLSSHTPVRHPDDLKDHNCLMWSGARERLNRWPFLIDRERRVIQACGNVKSSNGLALMNMCYQGLGIMRMAEHVALPAVESGQVEPLLEEYHIKDDDGIYAVFHQGNKDLPRVRAFLDFAYERINVESWT